jgi:hypothetical protein
MVLKPLSKASWYIKKLDVIQQRMLAFDQEQTARELAYLFKRGMLQKMIDPDCPRALREKFAETFALDQRGQQAFMKGRLTESIRRQKFDENTYRLFCGYMVTELWLSSYGNHEAIGRLIDKFKPATWRLPFRSDSRDQKTEEVLVD